MSSVDLGILSPPHRVDIGSGAPLASCYIDAGDQFAKLKTVGAWSWYTPPSSAEFRNTELYVHSLLRHSDMVFN
jgi:hypothetical protein